MGNLGTILLFAFSALTITANAAERHSRYCRLPLLERYESVRNLVEARLMRQNPSPLELDAAEYAVLQVFHSFRAAGESFTPTKFYSQVDVVLERKTNSPKIFVYFEPLQMTYELEYTIGLRGDGIEQVVDMDLVATIRSDLRPGKRGFVRSLGAFEVFSQARIRNTQRVSPPYGGGIEGAIRTYLAQGRGPVTARLVQSVAQTIPTVFSAEQIRALFLDTAFHEFPLRKRVFEKIIAEIGFKELADGDLLRTNYVGGLLQNLDRAIALEIISRDDVVHYLRRVAKDSATRSPTEVSGVILEESMKALERLRKLSPAAILAVKPVTDDYARIADDFMRLAQREATELEMVHAKAGWIESLKTPTFMERGLYLGSPAEYFAFVRRALAERPDKAPELLEKLLAAFKVTE